MRLPFSYPLVDALHLYLREASRLLGRQHLARKLADVTVYERVLPNDALLLENCYLDSSSLYCGQLEAVIKSTLSLHGRLFFSSAVKLPYVPHSGLEKKRK